MGCAVGDTERCYHLNEVLSIRAQESMIEEVASSLLVTSMKS